MRTERTAPIDTKVALDAHLFGCLSHGAHTFLHIETRVTSAPHNIDHPFNTGPTVNTNITYPTDMAQVSDSASEQCVPSYCLYGYYQTLAF
jgi:hypothetical protein